MTLTGKTAVVTGGNSGIGFATAQEMKAQGARVFITGRDQGRLQAAANELGVEYIVADQSSLEDTRNLVATIRAQNTGLDILFINAGVFLPTPVGSLDENTFDTTMNVNFKGAIFTIEHFLPLLNEGASIINLASINAYTGMANTSIYAASKAALNAYTRTASTELAPKKIRINSVNPGPIATDIFAKTGMPSDQLDAFASTVAQSIPLGQFGTAEAVAKLVSYLASDEAWFITGAEYNIDGGMNVNPGLRG